jgi:hypothetical protein
MLRCGQCGEAIVTRTNGGYELYYCNGRSKLGKEFCDMPHIRRAVIDTAVYSYFESVGLDIEATRHQLAESRDLKLAEVRALFAEAEREAQRARERLDRVRRDYQDGKLQADDWGEQRDQLTEEQGAAEAEACRLRDQEQEVTNWGELRDVEADVLRQLSEIRSAIAGEITDPDSLDAVRAAFSRLFERLILHPSGSDWYTPPEVPTEDDEEQPSINDSLRVGSAGMVMSIELVARETAIAGYKGFHPILRREPLSQKAHVPSPSR